MSIQKYAIVDHIGSLTSRENKRVYKQVYAQAKADELTAYTLKKVCLADSPYAKEVTSKMKYRARYLKNPQKVYLICDTLDSTAESILQIWESRNIAVEVFEVNGFMETHQIDIDGKASVNRRLAEIWSPAFGYSFSAPITRIQQELNAENFCKRPDHDALVASNETHFTKPFTSSEMFLEMNRCVATDKEIKEFRQYLDAYLTLVGGRIETKVGGSFGAFTGDAKALQEFLNPDYIICEDCGRPMRIHTGDCECPHCKRRFSEDIVLTAYYEDSSEDE